MIADQDKSSNMSVAEGVFFALAMSLDGFFGGLGAAFLGIRIWQTILLNFALSFFAVQAGVFAGRKLTQYKKRDLSWVGGVLFVALAVSKLM